MAFPCTSVHSHETPDSNDNRMVRAGGRMPAYDLPADLGQSQTSTMVSELDALTPEKFEEVRKRIIERLNTKDDAESEAEVREALESAERVAYYAGRLYAVAHYRLDEMKATQRKADAHWYSEACDSLDALKEAKKIKSVTDTRRRNWKYEFRQGDAEKLDEVRRNADMAVREAENLFHRARERSLNLRTLLGGLDRVPMTYFERKIAEAQQRAKGGE